MPEILIPVPNLPGQYSKTPEGLWLPVSRQTPKVINYQAEVFKYTWTPDRVLWLPDSYLAGQSQLPDIADFELSKKGRNRLPSAFQAAAAVIIVGAGSLLLQILSKNQSIQSASAESTTSDYNPPLHKDPVPPKESFDTKLPLRTALYTGTSWISQCSNPHVRGRRESISKVTIKGAVVHFPDETEPTKTNQENLIKSKFVPSTDVVKSFYSYYLGINTQAQMLSYTINASQNSSYYDTWARELAFLEEAKAQINPADYAYGGANGYVDLVFIPSTFTPMIQIGGTAGVYGVTIWPYLLITQNYEAAYRARQHEIGHTFGWPHNDSNPASPYHDSNSIMNGTNDVYDIPEPVVTWNDAKDSCSIPIRVFIPSIQRVATY